MNVASKALEQAYGSIDNFWVIFFNRRSLLLLTVFLLVISSAFSVIYTRDVNRRLNGELQAQEQQHDRLEVEGGKLLLEKSTWATPGRIQVVAEQKLGLQLPVTQQVTIVDLAN